MSETKAQISVSDCPASPYAIEITQPDGTEISIIGKGSMKNSWTETLDGYSIVKNKDGVYEVYVQTSSGNSSSTQTIYIRVMDMAESPMISLLKSSPFPSMSL